MITLLYLWLKNTGIHWSWNRISQIERNERRDSCKIVSFLYSATKKNYAHKKSRSCSGWRRCDGATNPRAVQDDNQRQEAHHLGHWERLERDWGGLFHLYTFKGSILTLTLATSRPVPLFLPLVLWVTAWKCVPWKWPSGFAVDSRGFSLWDLLLRFLSLSRQSLLSCGSVINSSVVIITFIFDNAVHDFQFCVFNCI